MGKFCVGSNRSILIILLASSLGIRYYVSSGGSAGKTRQEKSSTIIAVAMHYPFKGVSTGIAAWL